MERKYPRARGGNNSTRRVIKRGLMKKGKNSIREFSKPSIPVFMYGGDGAVVVRTLEEVCFFPPPFPLSFVFPLCFLPPVVFSLSPSSKCVQCFSMLIIVSVFSFRFYVLLSSLRWSFSLKGCMQRKERK